MFNTVNVQYREQLQANSANQNQGYWSSLPAEIAWIIFKDCKADLPSLALTCKGWTDLADNNEFRDRIRPAQLFGKNEWEELIKVKIEEEELPLPRCIYKDIEKSKSFVTYIPEKVYKITDDKSDVVVLDNVEKIDSLLTPILKTLKYTEGVLITETTTKKISELTIENRTHWVCLEAKILYQSRGTCLSKKSLVANNQRKSVSRLMDTVLSIYLDYIKTKETFIPSGPGNKYIIGQNQAFVNEKFNGDHITLKFFSNFRLSLDTIPDDFKEVEFLGLFAAQRYFKNPEKCMEPVMD